jgi:hypothetical protein
MRCNILITIKIASVHEHVSAVELHLFMFILISRLLCGPWGLSREGEIVRLTLRLIGTFFLAITLLLVVMDGARMFASSSFVFTPLGETWFKLDQSLGTLTLNTLQAIIQRYVHPAVWDPFFVTILGAPGWLVFGILGSLFLFLGRTRSHKRFMNVEGL